MYHFRNAPRYHRWTNSRSVALHTDPHYTDANFQGGATQVVFGFKEKNLSWVYNDRMWQWDYDKDEEARKAADESGHRKRSADWYEAYLSAYFEKPIQLCCVIAGVNVSSGYPYCVFGYKERGE